ncbi:MAG: Rieske 2Fe-2S domain-containing protein [Chloroflexi bacterium]|nr:Rieske 2Fe-2S domain-containing protein [Chloroflexota bacterium]
MLTKEQNDLLTLTGPGTPAGELLRRYWQPVALQSELPPGGAPLPVRLLGEDLVLFRDEQGRPGLLGLHCSHRGADLSYFLVPNSSAFGGGRGDGYSINWHVPIDDEHHWKYTFQYRAEERIERDAARRGRTPIGPDYQPVPHKANRYLEDRSLMGDVVYSGIPNQYFQAQDLCVTESRPIQDRAQEHLGFGDRAIVAARTMLIRAIKELEEGVDPPGVVRDPAHNRFPLVVRGDTISASVDWRTYWQVSPAALPAPQPR